MAASRLRRLTLLGCFLCLAGWPSGGKAPAGSAGFPALVRASPDANRLLEDVMAPYNRLVRPVQNNSERVVVWLSLELSQLIDVNLKEQIMETNIWLKQEWYDHKLKWDPSEYGGIEDMSVPAEQIWLPDIVLYNSAEGYFAVSIMTRAQVHFDGRVNWNPPAIFRSSCHIDITHFPFDTQNCKLKFGSWTFGPLLDLRHRNETEGPIERGIELKNYHQNVEWDIMEASARRNVEIYSCCPNDPYLDVTFYLVLRRKPLFYTINLIVPCIVITALSLLVFFLPSDSGEKVTLTISILVSLIFFLSVLIETIPSTSLAMPLLGKYLVFTMILITLSVCATVCVLNIHFRTPSTHDMSPWIKRWFIHILPKYLLLNTTHSQQASLLPEHLIYPPNQAYIMSQQSAAVAGPLARDSPPKLALDSASGGALQVAHQQHQLDVKTLSNRHPTQVSPNTSYDASSLFLPYLQSKAARRLQIQRSRSSERDQKSTSQLARASSSMMMNHYCDNKWTSDERRGLAKNKSQHQEQVEGTKVPSSCQENNKQSLRGIFGIGKRQEKKKKKERKRSDSSSRPAATTTPTTRNNYELYQQSSSSVENDYRHHSHFLARASVCQTNLWRVGPTRHCSQVGPLDYPTYYRPAITRLPLASQPLSSVSGFVQQQQQLHKSSSSSHHLNHQLLHHHNLHQCLHQHHQAIQEPSIDSGSFTSKTMPKCGAVGELVRDSVASGCQMSSSSSLLRPRHQLAPLKVDPGLSIRPKSGGLCSQYQPSTTTREHLAPRPADSSLESTTNLSWMRDVGDNRASTLAQAEYQQRQKELEHREQMLLLSQVPRANHANPPAASAINSAASPNPSIQSRCAVNSTAPMNSQKQHQPSLELGWLKSHSLSLSRDFHHSTLGSAAAAGLYALPTVGQAQHPPSSGLFLSGSVRGGPALPDTKSPAPVSDKLLWHNDIEFPPPPSFDCDLLNSSRQAQCHLPRSRSTDHRLHSAEDSIHKPITCTRVPNAAGFLVEPITDASRTDNRWPSNWQSHHSVGRALGQAYLQRLQPNSSLESSNTARQHSRTNQPAAMHEAPIGIHTYNPQALDCSLDLLAQSCSISRSKSQSSLERLVRSAIDASPTGPQVLRPNPGHRQAILLGHQRQQPCTGYHQQRDRSCTLEAQSRNLASSASARACKANQQGSLVGSGGCICGARSSLGPTIAAISTPRAVAVQSCDLMRFSQELDKAIENTMFIAQHIDNLDEFESVKENWKYIAMVIDRIFLIVFLVAGFVGSVAIFAMVPWSYYTENSPIDLHLAHLNALNLTGADFYHRSCP